MKTTITRRPLRTVVEVATLVALATTCGLADQYTITIQPGLNLIANQLDHGSNTLNEIMPSVPNGCVLYKYDNTSGAYHIDSFFDVWLELSSDGVTTLKPGEGAFLQSPTNFNLTFSGTPHVPVLPVSIPGGSCYQLSRQTNAIGTYDTIIGAAPAGGEAVYKWNGVGYSGYYYDDLTLEWAPDEPSVAVGEAVWISSPGGPTPPPLPVIYAGLAHSPLGNASLNVSSNKLKVENIGSSGLDGCRVSLPANAVGWVAQFDPLDPTNALPVGAYLEEQIVGPGGSGTNGELATMTMTKLDGTNWMMKANFSPLGSALQRVVIRSNGVPIHTSPVSDRHEVRGCALPPAKPGLSLEMLCPWKWEPLKDYGFCVRWGLTNVYIPSSISVATDGTNTGTWGGDEVSFEPVSITNTNATVTNIRLTGGGLPNFTITDESVAVPYAGLLHHSLGNATLNLVSNKLIVSNIGSSGQDGVRIDMTTNFTEWGTAWQPLDPNDTLPVGAYIQEQIIGTYGSVTHGLLGTTTITKVGTSNYVESADFSPIGASNVTVQVFDGTNLVAETTVTETWPGSGIFTNLCHLPTLPGDKHILLSPEVEAVFGISMWWSFYEVTPIWRPLDILPVLGDSVKVTPKAPSPWDYPYWDAAQLVASKIPVISITGETVSPLRLKGSLSSGQLSLQWFGSGTLQESTNLSTWTDLPGATSPYSTAPTVARKFYRLRQ